MKSISAKKLKKLGGKVPFSSITKPSKPIRKRPRSKSEFARIYGSKARVEFVKSLPCAACGVVGYSENAHVPPKGESGIGYKADYRFIAPLCGKRDAHKYVWGGDYYIGCHKTYDEHPANFAARFPDFDPIKVAAETERLWRASLGSAPGGQQK